MKRELKVATVFMGMIGAFICLTGLILEVFCGLSPLEVTLAVAFVLGSTLFGVVLFWLTDKLMRR